MKHDEVKGYEDAHFDKTVGNLAPPSLTDADSIVIDMCASKKRSSGRQESAEYWDGYADALRTDFGYE